MLVAALKSLIRVNEDTQGEDNGQSGKSLKSREKIPEAKELSVVSSQPSAEKAQRSGGETEKGIKGRINARE